MPAASDCKAGAPELGPSGRAELTPGNRLKPLMRLLENHISSEPGKRLGALPAGRARLAFVKPSEENHEGGFSVAVRLQPRSSRKGPRESAAGGPRCFEAAAEP